MKGSTQRQQAAAARVYEAHGLHRWASAAQDERGTLEPPFGLPQYQLSKPWSSMFLYVVARTAESSELLCRSSVAPPEQGTHGSCAG